MTPVTKQQVTVRIDTELMERARRLAYYTPGLSLNEVIHQAVEQFLANQPTLADLPPRTGELKRGRRLEMHETES